MNIYLVASDSYKKVDAKVKEILGNVLNVIKYDLRISTLNDVIDEANYFSLTGEQKYLIVRCDNLFKASKKDGEDEKTSDDVKLLENYLKNPNEKCTIIFTSLVLPDKRKKIYKLLQNYSNLTIINPLNKKELVYECIDILKKKKYQIDYETANYIVENSYVNYDIMLSELNKIYVLVKPGSLTINILKDIISSSVTNTSFSYVDAIIKRDLLKAHNASKNFEKLKIDPAMILVMLAKEFDILLMIKSGVSLVEIQKMLRKEDWQMKNYMQNADLYTINEIKKIIIKLNDYDYKYKSGKLNKSILINLLSLELCE